MIDSRSRVEDILNVILGNLDSSVLQPPQSRVEDLLQKLNEMIGDFDGKIPIHICTSGEYDHDTLMPTIENPEENAFYLVPANESGDDMYIEWIYTEGNRWERFGSGGGTVTIEQSDWNQNDSTADDYIKNKPDLTLKLDKNQGSSNSGKVMVVNSIGNLVPTKVQGGNITVTETPIDEDDYELGIEGDSGAGGDVSDVKVNGASVVTQGVANIPNASSSGFGVVRIGTSLYLDSSNILQVSKPSDAQIKAGTLASGFIPPSQQHIAAFFGLAKAAGDATQVSSSNAVGNYTVNAKSAISEMLGGSVAVAGTTPSIIAMPGVRYVCGEVSTIDITVPATDIIDVVFTSGSTPTVLTVTPPTGMTMKWANGFDPTTLDANTVYEINIMDGCYGVVGTWT